MTRGAANAFVHVNAVIEIDEVGQVVNAGPADRLACAPTLTNRFEVRTVRPDLRVAVHAGLGWRNACISEFLNGSVTVATIDAVVAGVMFVTELNGLFARKVRLSVVRRPVEFEQQPNGDCDKEDSAEDAYLGNEVRASMKDLAHLSGSTSAIQESTREQCLRK